MLARRGEQGKLTASRRARTQARKESSSSFGLSPWLAFAPRRHSSVSTDTSSEPTNPVMSKGTLKKSRRSMLLRYPSAPDWAPPPPPLSNQLTEPALPLGHHSPTALCLDTLLDLFLLFWRQKVSKFPRISSQFYSPHSSGYIPTTTSQILRIPAIRSRHCALPPAPPHYICQAVATTPHV